MTQPPTDLSAPAGSPAHNRPQAAAGVTLQDAGLDAADTQSQATLPPGGRSRSAPLDHDRILQATAACLAENGYDDTTIREISRRLGCAVGSIYRYFSDKRELLSVVTQQRFEPVAKAAEAGRPLSECQRMYLDAARAEPEQYRLMFWLSIVGPSRTATKKQEKQRARGNQTPDLVPAAVVPPVVQRILRAWGRQLNGSLKAQAAWIHLHGLVMLDQLDVAETLTHQQESTRNAAAASPDNRARVRNPQPEAGAARQRVTDPMLRDPA